VTVATDLEATHTHTDLDWGGARAIICGTEANGLTQMEVNSLKERVRIPMREPVESLNVASALAVILYEAARQRATFDHPPAHDRKA
jgi:tRNA G18 (ribose-2'-O)-methylase SpoU